MEAYYIIRKSFLNSFTLCIKKTKKNSVNNKLLENI